ncbi:MAG: NrtA/SsuA/CpmA family ABC transporter substrate-binding protein [Gammaproteobacteria bacterium]|nr:NrtA/SsuA/CpmA family ABC transporter substrate-binding protein [Gammaproteobacteria bacterium]
MFAVLAAVFFTACGSESGPGAAAAGLTLAAYEGELNALAYLASDRGLYAAQELDIELESFTSGREAVQAMLDGEADLATGSVSVFIDHYLLGERDLRIVASLARFDTNHLLARRDHGIQAPGDLRGKTIAVFKGTTSEYLLQLVLADHGLSPEDVTLVNREPIATREALSNGTVDAAMIWDPHAFALQRELGNRLIHIKPIVRSPSSFLLMSRRQWVAQNSLDLERLLRALSHAETYVVEHPEETRKYLARRFDLSSDYVAYISPAIDLHLSLPQSLVVSMDEEMRWFLDQRDGAARPVPDFLDAFHSDALRRVAPNDVGIYE